MDCQYDAEITIYVLIFAHAKRDGNSDNLNSSECESSCRPRTAKVSIYGLLHKIDLAYLFGDFGVTSLLYKIDSYILMPSINHIKQYMTEDRYSPVGRKLLN